MWISIIILHPIWISIIITNTAPFVSIISHQKEPLGCVVYSHCYTNDSYNKCIHWCCLPCNYVPKPFGTLQRVIDSQKVLISQYIWTQQKSISFLSEEFVAKFSDFLNFQVSCKGNYLKKIRPNHCTVFKKSWCLFFVHMRICPHTLNCTCKNFSYFVRSQKKKQDTKNRQ